MADISSTDDVINVSDITERVDELREERDGLQSDVTDAEEAYAEGMENPDLNGLQQEALALALAEARDKLAEWTGNESHDVSPEAEELATLESLLGDMCGYGGDHQWEGDWYPGSLIRDSYFTEAMQELVSDIGDLPKDIPAYLVIDWDATATNLQADYSSVEYEGVTYWYR